MRYPEAVIILTIALSIVPRPGLPGAGGGRTGAPSPSPSTAPARMPPPAPFRRAPAGQFGSFRPSAAFSGARSAARRDSGPSARTPAPPARGPAANRGAIGRPGAPAPRALASGVGGMRGISHRSRIAWRDSRDARHRHRRLFFVFYDPFWPYFAYSPFCYYSVAPALYAGPPAYVWAPVYGGAPYPAPLAEAPPDELAAANSGAEAYAFPRQGEEAFRAGDYKAATRAWRHAIVDEPNNGALLLRLSQALFASGEYDEAAGATQQALMLLPEEKWPAEFRAATRLYARPQDYKEQLKGLEKAVRENPDDPALRFELGFQYGFSGRRAEAVRELDKLLQLAPQDQLGRRLEVLLSVKISGEGSGAANAGELSR